jgi:phosphate:Na+ symporter
LHALDHASRLAETAEGIDFGTVRGGPDDVRAGQLCADAMRIATSVADAVAALPGTDPPPRASPAASGAKALSTDEALVQLERCARELEKLQRIHRSATLGAVANGMLTAEAAIVRVDTLRSLQALAWHAWRSTLHLVGR